MKELYIKNLCIEITRRCNMRCAHCMRGDAEPVDIPLKHISNLLRHVRRIFLFREGRSTEGFPNPVHGIYLTEENYVYGDLCLNAEGMILSNGDLSYVCQRQHALCPCGKLMQYLRKTLKERRKERLYK